MQKIKKTKPLTSGADCKCATRTASNSAPTAAHAVPTSFADWLAQPSGLVKVRKQWFLADEANTSQSGTWGFHLA